MAPYSTTFRQRMVQRLVGPGALSARALSQEVGVSQQTLSRWLREAVTVGSMSKRKTSGTKRRRPQDWAAEEKLKAVQEASGLKEEALGRFLRERGLHRATLERWRAQMLEGLSLPSPSVRRQKSPEARRVRELESELRRKEKALAEASALLLLKKKAAAIWGDEDDDTAPRSGK